jgi:hypothetical protein
MSAAYALKAARAAGVELGLDGTDLLVKAASEPPAKVLDALSRYWQVFFQERAAIAQFDGGLSRYEAEIQAFGCCVVEWLNRSRVRSTRRLFHC